jgi:creatinine amidohydrolase/Fe(II)-dependent formamide hydrolase-like protein
MRRHAALAAALLLHSATAAASPVMLEDLTWLEVRHAIQAGKRTILVPIGGTEQNGPHMVLGKHNARARELAQAIATQLGDALVAPVMAYVPEGAIEPAAGHMRYPGTITVDAATFEKTLELAARGFRKHGFRDVVLLGDHGGYRASLDRVAAKLNKAWAGSGERVHTLPEYYREVPHAGRDDTSLALTIAGGSLVRDPQAGAAAKGQGAAEDPSGATLEAGMAIRRSIVARSVEAIKKAAARR